MLVMLFVIAISYPKSNLAFHCLDWPHHVPLWCRLLQDQQRRVAYTTLKQGTEPRGMHVQSKHTSGVYGVNWFVKVIGVSYIRCHEPEWI